MLFRQRIRAAILVFVMISVFNGCRSAIPTADNPKYKEIENLWKTIPVYSGFNEGKTDTTSATAAEKLWELQLAPGLATPVTYRLDGRQYVRCLPGAAKQMVVGACGPSCSDGEWIINRRRC